MPSTQKSNVVTLGDREVRLRYNFRAADELSALGINLYAPETYLSMNPNQLASLVWAGQLHEKRPLTRSQVVDRLPLSPEEYVVIANAIATAIEEAFGNAKENPVS